MEAFEQCHEIQALPLASLHVLSKPRLSHLQRCLLGNIRSPRKTVLDCICGVRRCIVGSYYHGILELC